MREEKRAPAAHAVQVSYRAAIYQSRTFTNDTTLSSAPRCSPASQLRQGTLETAFSIKDPRLCAGDRCALPLAPACQDAQEAAGKHICCTFLPVPTTAQVHLGQRRALHGRSLLSLPGGGRRWRRHLPSL